MTGIRMFIYALWRFLGSKKTFTFRDIQDILGGIFAWGAKSFKSWMSWISRKVKVLELRNLHSAYINMPIPVILRPNPSVYDLQRLRKVRKLITWSIRTQSEVAIPHVTKIYPRPSVRTYYKGSHSLISNHMGCTVLSGFYTRFLRRNVSTQDM